MENYERPNRNYLFLEERQENARYWYEFLDWSGSGGVIQPPSSDSSRYIEMLLADTLNGWNY